MRTALAVVFGLVIFAVLFATIRGFAGPRGGAAAPQLEIAEPMPAGLRILYWCETCGFEVLVVRRGTENPPRHCGEPMTRREEILRGE
jgi:hypothetical protein